MIHSFIRWQPAPVIVGFSRPPLPAPCPVNDKFTYSLPVRGGDVISFISDSRAIGYVPGGPFFVGIMNRHCVNVLETYSAGFPVGTSSQMYCSVNLPLNLIENECYRLVFFGIFGQSGEWVKTSEACEMSSNGTGTGNKLIFEERNTDFEYVPLFVSNPLRVCYAHETTKIIEFSGSGYDYDFDYKAYPGYSQRLRLHLSMAEDQFSINTGEYRQANGVRVRKNTYIDHLKILHTGYFDCKTHLALAVALHHDEVSINGERLFARGDYDQGHIESRRSKDRYDPLWQASIEMFKQGVNIKNRACELIPDEFKIYGSAYDDVYA